MSILIRAEIIPSQAKAKKSLQFVINPWNDKRVFFPNDAYAKLIVS